VNDYDQEVIKDFLACNQDAKTRETGTIKYSLLMLILNKNIEKSQKLSTGYIKVYSGLFFLSAI